MPPIPDQRTRRIAENEVVFREINERLERDLRAVSADETERFAFVCECGRQDCELTIDLTFDEYERVRADPLHFAIVAGHDEPDVERVIETHERYVVVRKHESTRPIVEWTDTRER
ncbi:MAG: hypothetical protein JWQ48_2453 [Conexibacter sp.]|jgi:hypothetical protein|nr:hypothetical protein [Conexibacter sp.]